MIESPDNRHHLQPTGSRWGSGILHSYAAGCTHGNMEPDPRSMGVHPPAQSCFEETFSGGIETLQSSLENETPVAGHHSGELHHRGQELSDQQTRLHLHGWTFPTRHGHSVSSPPLSRNGGYKTSIHWYYSGKDCFWDPSDVSCRGNLHSFKSSVWGQSLRSTMYQKSRDQKEASGLRQLETFVQMDSRVYTCLWFYSLLCQLQ